MDKQQEEIMGWVYAEVADLAEAVRLRYGVDLDDIERSHIGDSIVYTITQAIRRKAGA
jgi:hypothetical protein